jgi:2-desacetyl-2-hydroxyethyl bacteriochlorophyllide A dehydrogenase
MAYETEAVVFEKPGEVSVRRFSLPNLGSTDILVRTTYSGVSIGTERWVLLNKYRGTIDKFPHVPGYQRVGVIEEAGSEVTQLKIGDRVFIAGWSSKFADGQQIHPDSWNGHVGLSVIDEKLAVPLPEGTKDIEACLGVMAAVGCLGVKMSSASEGECAVIIGQGMIGQMSAQAARRKGATVIASDTIPSRVVLSQRYSADIAVNANEKELKEVLREQGRDNADLVIDTTGISRMYDKCLELVRHQGRICMQGYYPDEIRVDFHKTHVKRATVTFPSGWDHEDLLAMLRAMETGYCVIEPLITHVFSFDRAPEAWKLILEKPENVLGVVFKWG